ncbi:hypothetical protein BX600DRAFT_65099 [Xylariales sp. PMI_506]|nr:hypothetical protein BX600DRAFT_65099 [Xylariales sp. PMI_506]
MDQAFMDQLWSERNYGTPLAIIFMVIPTVAVVLRLYAKISMQRPIEMSDYLSLVSWTLTIGFFSSMLIAVYMPAAYLDNPDGIDVPVSKITFSLNLLWAGACYCCKLSILCLYYRLLATPYNTFRWAIRIMFVLTACIGIASCLGFLLIFKDMSWWWSTGLSQHPEAETTELKMNLAVDIMSLLTDVILFTMPLPILGKLSLDWQKKVVLLGLFSLGFLTCIEVTIRIITTYGFNGALDAIQIQCLLMGIEPAMGITLCSLPVFFRLFRKNSNERSRYYTGNSAGQGNFYPLAYTTNNKGTRRNPRSAALDSIDMLPMDKPQPVLVQTEITVHSSHSNGEDDRGSQAELWK